MRSTTVSTKLRTRQLWDRWNTLVPSVLAVTALLMIRLSSSNSSASPNDANANKTAARMSKTPAATPVSESAAKTTGEHVPIALAEAGEYGENVYDYAKANDWTNADVKLAALRKAVKKMRADIKNQSAVEDRLDR